MISFWSCEVLKRANGLTAKHRSSDIASQKTHLTYCAVRYKYSGVTARGPPSSSGKCGLAVREMTMLKNFEDFQKYNKDQMDTTLKAWGQVSKGVQAIAAETADYSKKSFEEGSAALEKLLGAKSLEKAIEIQTAYAKTAYEGFVAQAAKMGELYADLAKETYKPFESFVNKAPVAK